jgi:uncharacterized protein (TIRG00374 family)
VQKPATWKRARTALLVAISGVSLYLVLPSLLAVASSWRALQHVNWLYAALTLVCEAASFLCLWELDRIALRTRAWFPVAAAQLSGNVAGRLLPGGGATATAFSVSMLRRAGIDTGEATAAFGTSTLLQIATTLALPVLALPAILGGAPVNHDLATAAYLGIAVLAALLAAAAAAFVYDKPLALAGRAAQWLLNHTIRRRKPLERLPQQFIVDRDFIRSTVGERWRAAALAAAGNTGFDYLALLAALRAVGAAPRPSLIVLAYATAELLALIPLTPGGLGFVEAGLVGTLTLAGVPAHDALTATLLYRLVAYWLPLPVGGGAYVLFRLRYDGLRNPRTRSGASPIPDGGEGATVAPSNAEPGGTQMETMFDRVEKTAGTQLTKMRWALGLNGLLSIAFGVVVLVWPGISLTALTILFGAYALATGIVGLYYSFTAQAKSERGWLILSSLAGIAVGVMVLLWTNISTLALLYVIGSYAIVLGVIAVGGAFWLPLEGGDTALMVLSGLVSILFGVVMFARPGDGALVTLALIAAFALVTGIAELVVAVGGKRLVESDLKRAFSRPEPQPSH